GSPCHTTSRSMGTNSFSLAAGSFAYVFVPQLRTRRDEVFHQLHTVGILQHLQLHAPGTQQLLLTLEGAVLADDHLGNPVEQDRPAAQGTGRERGVEHRFAVDAGALAAV